MRISQSGIDLIKEFEGCRLQAYPDPATGGEPITIGFGHTERGLKLGTVWTREQADETFSSDLEKFAQGVIACLNDAATTQCQLDAMVAFAFNVGLANFSSSTLLRLHKEGRYEEAARQFSRWNKASGHAMPGLTRRRAAEAKLYRGQTA